MEAKDIIDLRKRKKLSQKELADLLGVAPITVSRWERKEQKPSHLAKIQLRRLEKKLLNKAK